MSWMGNISFFISWSDVNVELSQTFFSYENVWADLRLEIAYILLFYDFIA